MRFMCFLFFFFKQKTAYEMRISDWSSDVCSSDLPPAAAKSARCAIEPVAPVAQEGADHAGGRAGERKYDKRRDHRKNLRHRAKAENPLLLQRKHQIGRASCRERVCQYV